MYRRRCANKERFIDIACLCLSTFLEDKFYRKKKLNRFSLFIYIMPLLLLIGVGYLLIEDSNTLSNTDKIFYYGITATTTLLGFLTSGFAIFATLSDRDLVYLMKKLPATNNGHKIDSMYDQTQIYFFEPFIFLGLTCALSFIGTWSLMIWPMIIQIIPIIAQYKIWFCVIYGLYLYLFFLSFISLKDFIFNIFQIGKLYSGFELISPSINPEVKKIADKMSEIELENRQ